MKPPSLEEQLAVHLDNRERYDFARQVDAEASAAERERIEQRMIALLLNWRKWYSEELFSPWTLDEAHAVHAAFPGAVDRISADSARGTIDNIIADIKAGRHLDESLSVGPPPKASDRERYMAALEAIDNIAGNLSDEAVEAVGGVNDAKSRALMVVTARQIAKNALSKGE